MSSRVYLPTKLPHPTPPHIPPLLQKTRIGRDRGPQAMPEIPLCKARKSTPPSKRKKELPLALQFPIYMGLSRVLSWSDLQREKEKTRGRNLSFLSLSLFLSIPTFISPLSLYLSISLHLYLYDLLLALTSPLLLII